MTEAYRPKNLEPVEASSSSTESRDSNVSEPSMLAVWLSLGIIIVAGLYGLYLGAGKKHPANGDPKATSSLAVYEAWRMS
jgi:hypothetical protein